MHILQGGIAAHALSLPYLLGQAPSLTANTFLITIWFYGNSATVVQYVNSAAVRMFRLRCWHDSQHGVPSIHVLLFLKTKDISQSGLYYQVFFLLLLLNQCVEWHAVYSWVVPDEWVYICWVFCYHEDHYAIGTWQILQPMRDSRLQQPLMLAQGLVVVRLVA